MPKGSLYQCLNFKESKSDAKSFKKLKKFISRVSLMTPVTTSAALSHCTPS